MNKFKLSESQLGMFLYNQFFKVPAQINPCGSVMIDEVIDFDRLKKAINTYIEKNEATRLRICNTLFGPRQYIEEYKPISIRTFSIEDEKDIRRLEDRFSNYRFNLTKDRLFRIELFKFKDGKGGLIGCFNHILCDGWSMEIAFRDIVKIYKGEAGDYKPGSYIKHLEKEKDYLSSKRYNKDDEFWKEEVSKLRKPKAGIIPYDKNNIKIKAKTNVYMIDKRIIKKVSKYCEENKIAENAFFTGVFNLYLWRISKLEEFIIQIVSSNRKNQEEKNTFGPFFDGSYFIAKMQDIEFNDYIKSTNENLFKTYLHYKYPVSKVTKMLKKKGIRGSIASKIYFSYQVKRNKNDKYKKKCKINWAPMKGTYIFDMLINLHDIENTGNLYIVINYLANRYKKETIDNIAKGMVKIINQVLENNKIKIGSIEI